MPLRIVQAGKAKIATVAALANKLWPDHARLELEKEFASLMEDKKGTFLLALDGERPLGFAQMSIRNNYVEGTDGGPIGYLEGIFVEPEHRMRGIARALLEEARRLAKQQGCRQFASDCELNNKQSISFHLACRFTEANRIVCFVSELA